VPTSASEAMGLHDRFQDAANAGSVFDGRQDPSSAFRQEASFNFSSRSA